MNIKIPIHQRNIEVRIKSIPEWKISEQDKKDSLKFLEDLELGKVNKGKKIGKSRQLKYLDILKVPLTFFNKPTSQLKLKDIENFEKALCSGKIKSQKNKPYSNTSKVDIRIALRTYLKWKLGDGATKLTDWFDMTIPKRTPDKLSEKEIEKLYKACKNNKERYLIAVLFDSGARAEEFINIRKEDIQLPEKNETYVKLTLKEEYSKTHGRVISLYWEHSLEAIRDFLNDRIKEGIKSNEQVFKDKYDNVRQFLNRLGKNVLNKIIYFHLFRKSSATYYGYKINRQQLCYRFGWAFSSRMPDIYISRAGKENEELDKQFNSTELEDLKKELDNQKQKTQLIAEALESKLQSWIKGINKDSKKRGLKYRIKDNENIIPI